MSTRRKSRYGATTLATAAKEANGADLGPVGVAYFADSEQGKVAAVAGRIRQCGQCDAAGWSFRLRNYPHSRRRHALHLRNNRCQRGDLHAAMIRPNTGEGERTPHLKVADLG